MKRIPKFYFIRPRWAKVLTDIKGNLPRLLVTVSSIAVGLFAVGMITTLHEILREDIVSSYRQVNPANIGITINGMDREGVESIRNIPGIAWAEAVRNFSLRLNSGKDNWTRINVKAIPDIEKMQIDKVQLLEGKWPPEDKEIVFEQHKLADANVRLGDMVEIMLTDGTKKQARFVGIVRDQTIGAAGSGGYFTANLQAYVTFNSLDWLDQKELVNQVYATVSGDADDLQHIRLINDKVIDKLEQNDHSVLNQYVRESYQHPNKVYVDAISSILVSLGFLVMFLSAFLITNTLYALLNQQTEQIGVIKTVGGRRIQIIGIYLILILIYSAIGLLVSLLLSGRAAYWTLAFLGHEINFNLQGYREIPIAVILQIVIAAIVPLAAGFIPILHGSSISIQEAFNGNTFSRSNGSTRLSDALTNRFHLPRPLILSLRNTFRRKGRLALTLFTLILGGAIFIATFSVQSSMQKYINNIAKYFVADLNLVTDRAYRNEDMQQVLAGLPEIKIVEGWATARVEILKENDKPGESINLLGPPADSKLIQPNMISGRWIEPGDQNAVVLNERFITNFPDLKIGDTIRFRVNEEKTDWVIVGFFQFAGKPAGYVAYTNYDYLSKKIHQPGKAYSFHIVSKTPLNNDQQKAFGIKLESYLDKKGIQINDISPGSYLIQSATSGLDTLVSFLLIMAMLSALVGSIGLTGTLSMNVMERTREIGLMRAIGASNRAVIQLVIVEGMIIGFISWFLGCILAFPISRALWAAISMSLFGTVTAFTMNPIGFLLWMGVSTILTILASVMPAVNAAQLTIRDALAYE